ncbi:MAG: D-sedoheptulose 7-phosphate isomerase [Salibacteraceae bacterium]|jgi:D-sedoheptulose 7-phosphate isomerase|nr:D-sedoheptulose 7-phosphate isomerase [Salibacteraceae bacterium]MDP4686127.1 D-sedoheptulose 7-phosphate isomerase [Salibacteraceae bacterium]MDP4763305.1 D-sedoheptulose 7-phosphate isomerase [Salibacteraceae bacterium]MDP4843864.1 D-sedoheptulose 7-phosphate isomerase [Salibacteraceae bacterium]MDP4933993.1 D-sedoheptulose 7-phosphate isomerase [Salibacteraceae bacterium]
MEGLDKIKNLIADSIKVKQDLLSKQAIVEATEASASAWVECLKNDGKILFCGNGGSAADAQHLAAELSGRFYHDRTPLFAEALHVNTSYLTAVANDYSYDEIYSRMIIAKGRKGDVLVGISTSGNSKNVVLALEEAKSRGMITIGMTGDGGGKMKNVCDILLNVPSNDTPRIQECHILLGHIICQLTEERLFNL